MLNQVRQLRLPPRTAVLHLLLCLVATASIMVGVTHSVVRELESRSDSTCHQLLFRSLTAAKIAYARDGKQGVQRILENLRTEAPVAEAALVSVDGFYLAHLSEDQIGRRVPNVPAEVMSFGESTRHCYVNAEGLHLREYRTPFAEGEERIGDLRLAFEDLTATQVLTKAVLASPLSAAPAVLLLIVGVMLTSRHQPRLSAIEVQLRRAAAAPSIKEASLQPLDVSGAATVGWNRVLEELTQQSPGSPSLDQRLVKSARSLQTNRIQEALDSLADGVAITDPDGLVTTANLALLSLVGVNGERSELLGQSMTKSLGCHAAELSGPLFQATQQERTAIQELTRDFPGGQRILRVARHPLTGGRRGEPRGHIWSVRDITQAKLADRMLNEFIDSATHELRTPLTNLRAYAETLAISDVLEVEQQKEFCNIISSEAARLAHLIDDLLDISSMQVGAMSISRQKVMVERLLSEVVAKVRPQMEKKEQILEVRLSEKLPELNLDKSKFTAALVNLLGNATKYTPAGGHIVFRAEVMDDYLVMDVEDSGVGISAEELPHVFDKFFRSKDERVQAENGSGLGLALAQEVIRLHGGSIAVHSQLGEGSKFTVKLPAR
ncbi:MAG: PAS domain-containing protein [Planctomycetales bacterium]|nr:PAS domain-containing protein [Planctomycetales bacterium]